MRPFDSRLLRTLPDTRIAVTALALLGLGQGVAAIAQAFGLSALVVAIAQGTPLDAALQLTVAAILARALCSAGTEALAARVGVRSSSQLRERLVAAVLDRAHPGGEATLTLAVNGAASIEPYLTRYLPALINAVCLPVAALVAMAVLDWRTAIIPLLTLPLLPLFAALIGSATAQATQRRWGSLSRLSGHFLDVMRGLPTLVGYGRAERHIGVIEAVSQAHRRATVATLKLAFLSSAALELLATISVALVAVFVGIRLAGGELTLAVAMPLILLAPEAYWPIRRVGAEFHAAADGADALANLLDAIEGDSLDRSGLAAVASGAPTSGPTAGSAPTLANRVEVRAVSFRYSNEHPWLVQDLHTDLAPGLTVITGASGSGKTTLLELLAGLRTPTTGTIQAPTAHLITQRPFLAAVSIRDNLTIGCDPADADQLRLVLTQVGLWEFIQSLPAGLDTPLGDDGFGLSAGQRARLVVARALLADDPVLLFDEPTAHLDPDTEADLHHVIRDLAVRRIVVVVTHRPGLVQLADHVIDLNEMVATRGHGLDSPGLFADPSGTPSPADRAVPPLRRVAALAPAPRDGQRSERDFEVASTVRPVPGIASAAALSALALCCGIALTATSGWLIVAASFRPQILTLLAAIVLVRTFGIARPALRYAERIRSHDAALAFLAEQRASTYARLVPLTPARLGRRSRGDVLAAVVDDLDDLAYAQVRFVVPALAMLAAGLLAAGLAAIVAPPAGLTMLALVAALGLVGLLGWGLERTLQTRLVHARGQLATITTLLVSKADEIVAVHGGARCTSWLRSAHDATITRVSRQGGVRAATTTLVTLSVAAATVALEQLLPPWVAHGLPTPVAALVVLLPVALAEVVAAIPDAVGALARAQGSRERLRALLNQTPSVDPRPGRLRTPGARAPQLTLEQISARWEPHRPALGPVDLEVAAGRHLAIVGPNGSGKSTLLAVLAHHLDPDGGRYRVDGADVSQLSLSGARELVAVVDDEPHVFASTLRENLRLARPSALDDELAEALTRAGLGPWLAGLPAGLDTRIGHGGRGVSGGERARLSLARAVLSGRPVLLLDEPTAHLDSPTAHRVLTDLREICQERTTVLVTHRPEGLDEADLIVTLTPSGALASIDDPGQGDRMLA